MANRIAGLTAATRPSEHPPMKMPSWVGLLFCLVLLSQRAPADEAGSWEKITATSPDKKFAMRIVCESKPEDPDNIEPASVKAIELVRLLGKEVVGSLSAGESH